MEVQVRKKGIPGISDESQYLTSSDAVASSPGASRFTPSGQRTDGEQFADTGFAGCLLKPVTQRDLAQCLALVLASTADSWQERSRAIVTEQSLRQSRKRARILLVEDNLVNQKVATRLFPSLR